MCLKNGKNEFVWPIKFHLLVEIIRFYYEIDKLFRATIYPDITHTSTVLTKLITVLPILYYFQILSFYGYSLIAACDTISNFFTIRGTC